MPNYIICVVINCYQGSTVVCRGATSKGMWKELYWIQHGTRTNEGAKQLANKKAGKCIKGQSDKEILDSILSVRQHQRNVQNDRKTPIWEKIWKIVTNNSLKEKSEKGNKINLIYITFCAKPYCSVINQNYKNGYRPPLTWVNERQTSSQRSISSKK